MKKIKRMLPMLVLSMLMVLAVGMTSAAYADDSGTYNGLTWKYTTADQTLEFSGSGYIPEREEDEKFPWDKYRSDVETIIFDSGVTDVGNKTFPGYGNLKLVKVPYNIALHSDPGYYDEESPSNPFSGSNSAELKIEVTGAEDVLSTEPAKLCGEWGYYLVGYGWSVESIQVPYIYEWLDEQEHADNGSIVAEKVYTGKAVKPSPRIVSYFGDKLVKGTDYTLSYSNNVNVGTAWITVTGTGDYYGKKEMCFVIYPKGTKLGKVKPAKKAFTVKWAKQTKKMKKKRITGYMIQYSRNKKFYYPAKTKTIKGYKKTSVKIKGLKSKKTYYVRVRTYYKDSEDQYRSKWSKYKKVKTK